MFELELVVFLTLFLLHAVLIKRMQLLSVCMFILIGCAPFIFYDFHYFGTLIPNTIVAKSKIYDLNAGVTAFSLLAGYVPNASMLSVPVGSYILYALIILALSLGLLLKRAFTFLRAPFSLQNQDSQVFLLALGGMIVSILYIYKKVFIFPWYLPMITIPLFLGVFYWLSSLTGRKKNVLLTLYLFPYLMMLAQFVLAAVYSPVLYPGFTPGARVQKYLEVGQQLYASYPHAVLLTSEIGGLGYSFKGKVVDAVGLVSPDALKYHPLKVPEERSSGFIGAIPVGYVKEVDPEIIVSLDLYMEALKKSDLIKNYDWYREPIYLPKDLDLAQMDPNTNGNALNILIKKR